MTNLENRKAAIEQQVDDVYRDLTRQSGTWTGNGTKLTIRAVLYALASAGWSISKSQT